MMTGDAGFVGTSRRNHAARRPLCVLLMMGLAFCSDERTSAPSPTDTVSTASAADGVARLPDSPPPNRALDRVNSAAELQRIFDASLIGGLRIKFHVRGKQCDALHVEGFNLTDSMMTAVAYGTIIYGRVLPGGVNSYAMSRGFEDVVYTNTADDVVVSFGSRKLTRSQIRKLRKCNETIAMELAPSPDRAPQTALAAPKFVQLSWASAAPGRKLYDGTYKHDATIVSADRSTGLITVRYVHSGTVEPKDLEAVSQFWYVRQ